jgi:hypothetical protein
MPKSRLKRFLLSCTLLLFIIGILVVGGLFIIFRNAPLGMYGGDCPDPSSYGSVTIRGTAQDQDGNPVEGVLVQAQKSKGGCPQSTAENIRLTSARDGKFEGGISYMIGDSLVHIIVEAAGYQSYEFDVSNIFGRFSVVQLQIILGERLKVEWTSTTPDWLTLEAELTATNSSRK